MVTNNEEGGGATKRREGGGGGERGQVKFYSYEKGGWGGQQKF